MPYKGMKKLPGVQCRHCTVNHTITFIDPITSVHAQDKSLCSLVVHRVKKENRTHRSILDSYLCEFVRRKRFISEILEAMKSY